MEFETNTFAVITRKERVSWEIWTLMTMMSHLYHLIEQVSGSLIRPQIHWSILYMLLWEKRMNMSAIKAMSTNYSHLQVAFSCWVRSCHIRECFNILTNLVCHNTDHFKPIVSSCLYTKDEGVCIYTECTVFSFCKKRQTLKSI